jgi:PBP1b-binding outer membrane lipoprotein LpoB
MKILLSLLFCVLFVCGCSDDMTLSEKLSPDSMNFTYNISRKGELARIWKG